MKKLKILLPISVTLVMVTSLIGMTLPALAEEPSITPSEIDEVIVPGGTFTVEKTVQTPEVPPLPDIVFLADTTGSMGDAIANVQANIVSIANTVLASAPDAEFAIAEYKDLSSGTGIDPFDYQLNQSLTSNLTDVQNAVNAWVTDGYGGDVPEQQLYALDEIATSGAVGFRANSTRVIVWIGDNPGHDPSGPTNVTLADVIADLTGGANSPIMVIAVPVDTGQLGLDNLGQATAIATATGGDVLPDATPAEVSDTILAALTALPITVSMTSDAVYPITTSFEPASIDIVSGGTAVFTETITVALDAPAGVYTASDWALIDGNPMVDASGEIIYETKTIRVPDLWVTGGGQINTGKKKNDYKASFAGVVGHVPGSGLDGQFQLNLKNVSMDDLDGAMFHSTQILEFYAFDDGGDGPAPPPGYANAAFFIAEGRLNNEDGWLLAVLLADRGEPGKSDSIIFELIGPSVDYTSSVDFGGDFPANSSINYIEDGFSEIIGTTLLTAGNFQLHSMLSEEPPTVLPGFIK